MVEAICARCTRDHVRDIEGKLDEQWWAADPLHHGVLVVDDDPHVRLVIRVALEAEGHTVHEAASVAEAREWLQAPGTIDVVVLDVRLPDGDGWTLRDEIESGDRLPAPSVVMLSAYDDERRAGAFLAKPFDTDELVALVDRAIQAGAGRA